MDSLLTRLASLAFSRFYFFLYFLTLREASMAAKRFLACFFYSSSSFWSWPSDLFDLITPFYSKSLLESPAAKDTFDAPDSGLADMSIRPTDLTCYGVAKVR